MNKELRETPLDSMNDEQLKEYIFNQTLNFPQRLTVNEQASLCNAMWNSVITMKLKCMSQQERNDFYAKKKRNAEIKQEVATQVKQRKMRLKTHHVYV